MTREETLLKARDIVCVEKESQYGEPENNFALIARFWESYVREKCVGGDADVCFNAEDVAIMMSLLKVARIASGQAKEDNYIDLAGYAACAAELATENCWGEKE